MSNKKESKDTATKDSAGPGNSGKKPKAPDSYLNAKRPPLLDAFGLEKGSFDQKLASLTSKGYYTARPRPWGLARSNRGHGRGDFAILDAFDDIVVEGVDQASAELIIAMVNTHSPKNKPEDCFPKREEVSG